ncbi:hypothetical protein GCM10029978_046110 [Actinoallomurus acanthiterrae]
MLLGDRGYCRLCCRQARLVRAAQRGIDVPEANRGGQQLFLADLFRQKRPSPAPVPPAAWPDRYPVEHRQLVLCEAERDLAAGWRSGNLRPPIAALAAAFDQVISEHAARHGWGRSLTSSTRSAIRVLQAIQDTPGASIQASQAADVSTALDFRNLKALTEILTLCGMLTEDRQPTIDAWFTRRTAGLPEPMAEEFRHWYQALRDGSTTPPRSRPRSPRTVRGYVSATVPMLHAWAAAGHQSLREITRADIIDLLPDRPHRREKTLTAVRAMFRFLRARRLVFTNPTARLRGLPTQLGQPLPADLASMRAAVHSDKPARAAIAALVIFHGPRPRELCHLELTDARDGRLHLPGRTIVLAEPVRAKLAAWLDERARRWPETSNPYLFINGYTAVRTSTVSPEWITRTLGLSAKALREDRILHEALASNGDIRLLCDLFGLSPCGTRRYVQTHREPAGPHFGTGTEAHR